MQPDDTVDLKIPPDTTDFDFNVFYEVALPDSGAQASARFRLSRVIIMTGGQRR